MLVSFLVTKNNGTHMVNILGFGSSVKAGYVVKPTSKIEIFT